MPPTQGTTMIRRFFLAAIVALMPLTSFAQLTVPQLNALHTAACADPAAAVLIAAGDSAGLRAYLNAPAAPAYYVWRTDVSRAEVYHQTSAEATTWNWTTYKTQGATEQNAWTQMCMGDLANMALPNLRAGVAASFTGSAAATTQRDHVLAAGKRAALRVEKSLASGTGTLVTPAVMTWEGALRETDGARMVFRDSGTLWGC